MIARLRPRERLLLIVGLSIAGVLLLALLVFFPQVRRAAVMQVDVARKQTELRRATELALRRAEIERKHAAATQSAAALLSRVPNGPDLPGLIVRLDEAMASSGVELQQISFPPETLQPTGTGNIGALPVQLRVRGTYPQVRVLVQSLEDSARLVELDRIALTGTDVGIVADVALRALFIR